MMGAHTIVTVASVRTVSSEATSLASSREARQVDGSNESTDALFPADPSLDECFDLNPRASCECPRFNTPILPPSLQIQTHTNASSDINASSKTTNSAIATTHVIAAVVIHMIQISTAEIATA